MTDAVNPERLLFASTTQTFLEKQGSLTHTFSEVGTYIIGCHEPGHWESGMKATVEVT